MGSSNKKFAWAVVRTTAFIVGTIGAAISNALLQLSREQIAPNAHTGPDEFTVSLDEVGGTNSEHTAQKGEAQPTPTVSSLRRDDRDNQIKLPFFTKGDLTLMGLVVALAIVYLAGCAISFGWDATYVSFLESLFQKYQVGVVVATVVFLIFMWLKFCEQWRCIVWVLQNGDAFVRKTLEELDPDTETENDFYQRLEKFTVKGEVRPFPFFPGNIKFTRWLRKLYAGTAVEGRGEAQEDSNTSSAKLLSSRLSSRLTRSTISLLFRYPSLMLACSILNVLGSYLIFYHLNDQPYIRLLYQGVTLSLLFGLLGEVIHLVLYRFKFGSLDNLISGEYVGFLNTAAYQVPLPNYVAIRRLILILVLI